MTDREKELYRALSDLFLAGCRQPRHTPAPGGASSVYTYRLSAADAWEFDGAMKNAAEVLGVSDMPYLQCVGNPNFDQSQADAATRAIRQELFAKSHT